MKVKVKQLRPNAKLPTYATDGSGAFDLYAVDGGYMQEGENAQYGTGLSFEVPEGHVMLIFSRSGHGARGIRLANCVGVIDSDYRGEVFVMLHNDGISEFSFVVNAGDRIAQALILPIPRVEFEVVDELSPTARGDGGFGSTGS